MTVLCLTGWQQPADALTSIAPDALHFDYASYTDVGAMFAALPRAPKLAIGWSLGGQLLARAAAEGYCRPQAVLLLGAPFQWLADEHFKEGFPQEMAGGVREDYRREPEAMLKRLNGLVALGDAHEKQITRTLNRGVRLWENGMYWLNELTQFSCRSLDFSAFPRAIIVHGMKDKVIYPVNAEAYAKALPQCELMLWPECAHAPHLHDSDVLRSLIAAHV